MSGQVLNQARTKEILHSIVEEYIDSGEPVASRTIARRRNRDLSPATIRNVMADLCEEGYLAQPHTSAGRVPTLKAFRSFVQSVRNRVHDSEVSRMRAELQRAGTVEERIERSSHMLTEISRNIGIVAAIPTSEQTLDQIELLALADRRVLMILVTGDHMVRNRVITIDENVGQDELNSIRNYVNTNFHDWKLNDIHREMAIRLERESALYDAILKRLTVFYDMGLFEIGMAPEVHMEGASNLVGLDMHLTREKMRELFRTLEEKKLILQLLERFLEQSSGAVAVHVGLGDEHPSMGELSLIGISVAMPSGLSAKIAVLGPVRMNYPRVMSAVLHLGQAFGTLE